MHESPKSKHEMEDTM